MAVRPLISLLTATVVLQRADAQIRVVTPHWLKKSVSKDGLRGRKDGFILGSTATFGAPPYGEEILGQIHWDDPGDHMHCTEDDYDVPTVAPDDKGMGQKRLVNVVMVRRGKCPFTTKVRVAAKKGAHAVIIVDAEDSKNTATAIHNTIVADDGFGDSITVPSILIDKDVGQKLIDASKKSTVIVELNWDVPDLHIVTVDMWMSAGSKATSTFLKEFAPFRRVLADDMSFFPHYHVYSVKVQDEPSFTNLCSDSEGRFCTDDPDGAGSLSGKDVLHEDVRQLCIHESTGKKREDREKVESTLMAFKESTGITMLTEYSEAYWNYVEALPDACPLQEGDPANQFGEDCSYNLMKTISGIDVDAVRKCEYQTYDQKLKHELENTAWSKSAIRINGWRYAGQLDAETVAKAICSGFVHHPRECKRVMDGTSLITKNRRPGVSFVTFLKAAAAIIMFVLVVLFLYRRFLTKQMQVQIREEVMLEVQSQMGSYAQM